MNSDGAANLELNREVRRILVSHWLDLGRLSVHSLRSSVHIRGTLSKLGGSYAQLTSAILESMSRKIKAAAGTRSVHMEFDNWFLNPATGSWESAASREKRTADVSKGYETTTAAAYEIRDQAAGGGHRDIA